MYCCRVRCDFAGWEIGKDGCDESRGIGAKLSTKLTLLYTAITTDIGYYSTEQIGSFTMTLAILIRIGDVTICDFLNDVTRTSVVGDCLAFKLTYLLPKAIECFCRFIVSNLWK